MASGPESGAAEQPPELPVKQRRSRSSWCSSEDGSLPPGEGQHQYDASNDVFHEPAKSTDCWATFCPIHQLHGPSRHQLRFFSDITPPPVPKKRLARTLSLPAADPPPLSPLSPKRPQGSGAFFPEGPPGPALSQLSFDTPDENLPFLFRNFEDQMVVFQGIQQRQALFLQSVARSIDAGVLLQEGAAERGLHPYLPRDFLLCEEPTRVGDDVYYGLRCPKLPGRRLALRVHARADPRAPAHPRLQHVNVQHAVALFQPRDEAAPPPGDPDPDPARGDAPGAASVEGFLRRGLWASVERDRPDSTLREFVERCAPPRGAAPVGHHRQVCVLLLQVLAGSQHLYSTSGRAPRLGPAEIALVWPRGDEPEAGGAPRTRGSPRVVLSPDSPARCGPRPLAHIRAQTGALVRYLLEALGGATSSYLQGLHHLDSALQAEGGGLAEAGAALQALLWGPRPPLLHRRAPGSGWVHNWLATKRALLVLKLAERGLVQDGAPLDWEDGLCLKYLSTADVDVVERAAVRLWPPLDAD